MLQLRVVVSGDSGETLRPTLASILVKGGTWCIILRKLFTPAQARTGRPPSPPRWGGPALPCVLFHTYIIHTSPGTYWMPAAISS